MQKIQQLEADGRSDSRKAAAYTGDKSAPRATANLLKQQRSLPALQGPPETLSSSTVAGFLWAVLICLVDARWGESKVVVMLVAAVGLLVLGSLLIAESLYRMEATDRKKDIPF